MKHNVVTPSVGESITEVSILKWAKQNGQAVKEGDIIVEIESDKATVEVVAPANGVLQILKQPGERLPIGELIGTVDDAGKATTAADAPAAATSKSAPAPAAVNASTVSHSGLSPAVQRIVSEENLNPSQITGTGKDGRLTKGDALQAVGQKSAGAAPASRPTVVPSPSVVDRPGDRRVPMTMLRSKIAERLVFAQHNAAILTTFNEVDMSAVMALRNKHKDAFKAKHGVALSFMSFFTRASVEALKTIPAVNASIDGRDIIYHDYYDVGIAVGTERGLVVPVVRNAGGMGFVDIEKAIGALATKARDGKLSLADLSGGTFTISNGGVYGSLLSTPILNPPQSAILGMHKILERPIAVNGKVEIRPMMYLALSYDHRMIDGKEAVTFLIAIKDALEAPDKLGLEY